MKLEKYLEVKGLTKDDFARIIDVSDSYIYALVRELVHPGRHLAKLIELQTDGLVTRDDWLK
jgi:hypothetical protein